MCYGIDFNIPILCRKKQRLREVKEQAQKHMFLGLICRSDYQAHVSSGPIFSYL